MRLTERLLLEHVVVVDTDGDGMLPGEYDRFRALIDDPDVAIAIADLAEIAGWLSGQYTARPTQPSSSEESSPTPPGPSSTDGPPAAVLTFSRPEPAPV